MVKCEIYLFQHGLDHSRVFHVHRGVLSSQLQSHQLFPQWSWFSWMVENVLQLKADKTELLTPNPADCNKCRHLKIIIILNIILLYVLSQKNGF